MTAMSRTAMADSHALEMNARATVLGCDGLGPGREGDLDEPAQNRGELVRAVEVGRMTDAMEYGEARARGVLRPGREHRRQRDQLVGVAGDEQHRHGQPPHLVADAKA